MKKILYSAGKNQSAKLSLNRFLSSIDTSKYDVRILAWRESYIPNTHINWSRNANEPFRMLAKHYKNHEQSRLILDWNPDLIISDMDLYVNKLGTINKIPVWTYSSSLLSIASLDEIHKSYVQNMQHSSIFSYDYIMECANYSDRCFIHSHLADIDNIPYIKEWFEWVRPIFYLAKDSKAHAHQFVSATMTKNIKFMKLLSKSADSVYFTQFQDEVYQNFELKNIFNNQELCANIKNADIILTDGSVNLHADCFYNQKFSYTMPDYKNFETICASYFSEIYKTSKNAPYHLEKILDDTKTTINVKYNQAVKNMPEYIDSYFESKGI